MYPVCWTPEHNYIYEAPQTQTGENLEEQPPPYEETYQEMSTTPPFPLFDPGHPDHGFPLGVVPVLAGFQPVPPPPPAAAPAPAPAAPAPPPSPFSTVPDSHVDPSAAGLGPGMSYLFPAKHTSLHVVAGSFKPYESPNTPFQFSILRAPCSMTVAELIERLGVKGPDNKVGVTECIELGDGSWAKGVSIVKKDDAAKKTLAQIGWDETRGLGPNRPVWLVVMQG